MNAKDKQLVRALVSQLLALGMMGAPKAERYQAAATACDQLAERLRGRADEAALSEAKT